MISRNTFAPLKYVEILLALEQFGSISRAADTLEMTQSALTKALRRAEQELGQVLFTRHARGVVPTAAGQITLEHARIIKNHSVETLNRIDDLRDFPGLLNIGGGASFLDSILPQAIAQVVTQYPSIEIRLRIESVPRLLDRLRDGELDLLFISEPLGVARLNDVEWTPLINNTMEIVARPGHPLAGKPNVSMAELDRFGWVLGSMNDPQRQFVESTFRAQGRISPRVTVETISRGVSLRIVQQSDLLTLVPGLGSNVEHRDVVRIDCPQLRWVRTAGTVTRIGFKLPTGGRVLLNRIRQICREAEPDSH